MNTRSTNPVSVAFAEDHILVRKGIISYLKDLGGIDVIIEAGDGRELIRKIQRYKKKPDVCIIDIIMPGMNGFETVAEIRRRWHNMKILVLSTYTDDLYVVKMIRLGVNGYLSKACSPGELKDAIVSIFERGHYYSDFFVEKTSMALQGQNTRALDLSEKELWLLQLCCSDMTYQQIAQVMNITPKSVEGYRDNLFKKLKVNNRIGLVLFAIKNGIVAIERSMPE